MKKLKCFFVLEKSAVLLISLYQTYVKLEKDTVMEVRKPTAAKWDTWQRRAF